MWDFVADMPDGILKTMFLILQGIATVALTIYKYLFTDLEVILTNTLEGANVPSWIVNIIDWLLDRPSAWVYDLSLFELIFGFGLVIVLIFGIVKYFTDIIL